ncbi:hypothetical protein AB0A77_08360 [Streptomyces varsoviensis]|uniref:hypothetical protein n=1 Tax=Streptomyces varsoviensis TaxID=67373 RepID=UPI0033DDB63B
MSPLSGTGSRGGGTGSPSGTSLMVDPALPPALAGLGLAVLAVRVRVLALWSDAHASDAIMLGIGAQTAVLVLLVASLTVIGSRSLAARLRAG